MNPNPSILDREVFPPLPRLKAPVTEQEEKEKQEKHGGYYYFPGIHRQFSFYWEIPI
jgi:hypothetical protein